MKKILFTLGIALAMMFNGCTEDDDTTDLSIMAGKIAIKQEADAFNFTVGDGLPDFIENIQFLGLTQGENRKWLVTDESANILLIFDTLGELEAYDFDNSETGKSLLWYLRFNGAVQGVEVGNSANSISGDSSLSNSLDINQNPISSNAGSIAGGPFTFVVGDKIEDKIPAGAITQSGTISGAKSTWVITDTDTKILGLPATLEDLENEDFEGAEPGDCLIWFASYENSAKGIKKGELASDIVGDFSLSNSITVTRQAFVKTADAGSIAGGPFTFTVGDGTSDFIPSGAITQSGTTIGSSSTWIITDDSGVILGLPATLADVEANDFEPAAPGDCQIWFATYEGQVVGLEVGMNATEIAGDFDLSNAITVTREAPAPSVDAGTISGGPFAFTVGDGTADLIPAGAITQSGTATGTDGTWLITSASNEILALPMTLADVEAYDFDGSPAGDCFIWFGSYEGVVTGLAVGEDATAVVGNFDLSNSITVTKSGLMITFTAPVIAGGPFVFTVGDGIGNLKALANSDPGVEALSRTTPGAADPVSIVTVEKWLLISPTSEVLANSGGAKPIRDNFDYEAAGTGNYEIYKIIYEDGNVPANIAVGDDFSQISGDYGLSNVLTVTVN